MPERTPEKMPEINLYLHSDSLSELNAQVNSLLHKGEYVIYGPMINGGNIFIQQMLLKEYWNSL